MKNNILFDTEIAELGLSSKDTKILLKLGFNNINDLTKFSIYVYFFLKKKTGINAKKLINRVRKLGMDFADLEDRTLLESICCENKEMEESLTKRGLSYITVRDFCCYPTDVLKAELGTTYYKLKSELHTNGYLLNGEQEYLEDIRNRLERGYSLTPLEVASYLGTESTKMISNLKIGTRGLNAEDIISLTKKELYKTSIPKYVSDDMLFLIHSVGLKTQDEIKDIIKIKKR